MPHSGAKWHSEASVLLSAAFSEGLVWSLPCKGRGEPGPRAARPTYRSSVAGRPCRPTEAQASAIPLGMFPGRAHDWPRTPPTQGPGSSSFPPSSPQATESGAVMAGLPRTCQYRPHLASRETKGGACDVESPKLSHPSVSPIHPLDLHATATRTGGGGRRAPAAAMAGPARSVGTRGPPFRGAGGAQRGAGERSVPRGTLHPCAPAADGARCAARRPTSGFPAPRTPPRTLLERCSCVVQCPAGGWPALMGSTWNSCDRDCAYAGST